jgi:hypothetical protein
MVPLERHSASLGNVVGYEPVERRPSNRHAPVGGSTCVTTGSGFTRMDAERALAMESCDEAGPWLAAGNTRHHVSNAVPDWQTLIRITTALSSCSFDPIDTTMQPALPVRWLSVSALQK